ncbi:hypothetical protein K432DRAFT_22576 [Lepidopterella palustris CBS 459.81]|uniref:Uncharacterized protein n=1 Tax=Lepidopterella palustris CBS 459.81 TaxID=1314670 RepID=A0A8E2J8A7_9PEZI|nr:hypothetical protein K432DRAFT_22576 [Lepidopterella palustris CBS 459.81]
MCNIRIFQQLPYHIPLDLPAMITRTCPLTRAAKTPAQLINSSGNQKKNPQASKQYSKSSQTGPRTTQKAAKPTTNIHRAPSQAGIGMQTVPSGRRQAKGNARERRRQLRGLAIYLSSSLLLARLGLTVFAKLVR